MAKGRTRKEKIVVPGYDEMAYGIPHRSNEAEVRRIHPMNDNQSIALEYLRSKTLTILTGPPGTAKTLLSVYVACEKLQKREIDKIYYIKPIVDVPGERGIGYLPGDKTEKLEPYFASLKDSLCVFMSKGKSDYLIDKKIIEFVPIDFLRGRSLDRCFIIADEMQNASTHSVLTILTRLGNNSFISLMGDVVQRDLSMKYGSDGLSDALSRLSRLTDNVGHVTFTTDDIVRSGFVKDVILSYSDLYQR
jgi:phosphate starvation-inducible PhoH-like protein